MGITYARLIIVRVIYLPIFYRFASSVLAQPWNLGTRMAAQKFVKKSEGHVSNRYLHKHFKTEGNEDPAHTSRGVPCL